MTTYSTTTLRTNGGALADWARALVAVALLGSATFVSAQSPLPSGAAGGFSLESLVQWALTQGGALGVLCVVLFFYRRDWKTAVEFWKDQNATRDVLVKEATRAQVETAAALREATVVIHGLKRVMQEQYPGRRFEDTIRDMRDEAANREPPRG